MRRNEPGPVGETETSVVLFPIAERSLSTCAISPKVTRGAVRWRMSLFVVMDETRARRIAAGRIFDSRGAGLAMLSAINGRCCADWLFSSFVLADRCRDERHG
jgi:hypothetical protein